jgi:hypothetical protein
MSHEIVYEEDIGDVHGFFGAFNSLLTCTECGCLDKDVLKADMWNKIIDTHRHKTGRYEVKMPYLIRTNKTERHSATLVITTHNCSLEFHKGKPTVKHVRGEKFSITLALANMQLIKKVVNVSIN